MSETKQDVQPVKSGAAGAAKFVGWDSRKYNYYQPKGRKATHYEDMTLDVQPDPKRYLLQDWIISFGDGTPTYSEKWTEARSSNWHAFRSIDEEWERTHYQRQSTIVGMISQAIENARRSGAAQRFDKTWVKVLEKHLGAYKHAEFGLGTALMHAQRYGYTQMINTTILTNASYKLRFSQDLTLYLGDIGLDIEGFDAEIGKTQWLEDPIWQPTRKLIETIGGATDYLEKYFAVNVVFEALVGAVRAGGATQSVANGVGLVAAGKLAERAGEIVQARKAAGLGHQHEGNVVVPAPQNNSCCPSGRAAGRGFGAGRGADVGGSGVSPVLTSSVPSANSSLRVGLEAASLRVRTTCPSGAVTST